MTNPDPWAAASGGNAGAATAAAAPQSTPAGNGNGAQPQSGQEGTQLAADFSGQGSQLFGNDSLLPSLFNKTHFLGTVLTGIITEAPYDVHSMTFGENRRPKYWSAEGKPVTDAVDPVTRQANRPIKDTVIPVQTEYRFTAQELAAIGRDADYADDGARVFYAGGQALKATRDALKRAARNGVRITCEADLVGKRITVKRAGQKPNPGGNPSWIYEVEITNP